MKPTAMKKKVIMPSVPEVMSINSPPMVPYSSPRMRPMSMPIRNTATTVSGTV